MTTRSLKTGLLTASLCAMPLVAVAAEGNPYLKPDDSWISLSGTVTSTASDTFTLDYGSGLVTVEMDDWNWYADESEVLSGDRVTIYGEVDDDLFEATSIEASSVYVENLGTYFYASPADEEAVEDVDFTPTVPIVVGDLTLTGTVRKVDGHEFTINSGNKEVTVDTAQMLYNPLDDEGYQKVSVGDTVSVTGSMNENLFETRELMADSVVTLNDEQDKKS